MILNDFIIQKFNLEDMSFTANNIETVCVSATNLYNLISDLNKMPEYNFNLLTSFTAVDLLNKNQFELLYSLYSTTLKVALIVKTKIDRNAPIMRSICAIFPSANFDEREVYDLFGIKFEKHPNLKRILMTNDWVGHPLRKDYEMTDERLAWNNR